MTADGRRVALALGGGGARGYAHIGVIAELEERGFEIVAISGTSMGALVGGLHAAGRLDGYTAWVTGLTQRDVLRLLDPSLRAPGVIGAEKIMARVRDLLAGARIEDLPIPFTAVATDLLTGKEVWFQDGPVDEAIRASIAMPSVITPVVMDGRVLADGGLLNVIPIAPLTGARADLVVAVSLHGPRSTPLASSSRRREPGDRFEAVRRAAAQLRDRDIVRLVTSRLGGDVSDEPEAAPAVGEVRDPERHGPIGLRTFDVVQLSLEAMQTMLTRYRLASYPPDVLIELPIDACGTIEFHRATEMIELGRSRTRATLEALPGEQTG